MFLIQLHSCPAGIRHIKTMKVFFSSTFGNPVSDCIWWEKYRIGENNRLLLTEHVETDAQNKDSRRPKTSAHWIYATHIQPCLGVLLGDEANESKELNASKMLKVFWCTHTPSHTDTHTHLHVQRDITRLSCWLLQQFIKQTKNGIGKLYNQNGGVWHRFRRYRWKHM